MGGRPPSPAMPACPAGHYGGPPPGPLPISSLCLSLKHAGGSLPVGLHFLVWVTDSFLVFATNIWL